MNCGIVKKKKIGEWAIRSQGSWKQDQGSETRCSNLRTIIIVKDKPSTSARVFFKEKIRYSPTSYESRRNMG